MIPFDFEYYKPSTIREATQTFQAVQSQGKTTVYYNGGTEFITFARLNKIMADAIIDLKGIQEVNILEIQGDQLIIGTSVSLNRISESFLFPLLGKTVKKVADHTSRNKITLGGNLNSRLNYREALLPLLLSDAQVKISGIDGDRQVYLKDVYTTDWSLSPGELLTQIIIDTEYTSLPFCSIKKTKISKVGYPIVTVAALLKDHYIRAAFSGVCEFPFRSVEVESVLNDSSLSIMERVNRAVTMMPDPILDDIQSSAEYREFVLKNTLQNTLEALEAAQ